MDEITKNFNWFRDDGIFAPMLNDVGRNKFYQEAIFRSVAGKVVADVGAGTGLLTVMCCAAGAQHVYAIEKDPGRATYLKQIIERVGVADRVTVVAQDFLDTDIRADFYVSETINTQIFGEDILILANHARKFGGVFIPSYFDVWAEVYEYHPIFTLDQTESDAGSIVPGINLDQEYLNQVNRDFQSRHPVDSTLYVANQLNKLFTLLPRFQDVKLNRIWQGTAKHIDLNQEISPDSLHITVPSSAVPNNGQDHHLVLFWRAGYQDIVMNSSDVWFGNVTKTIEHNNRQHDLDISIWYDAVIRNWRLCY